MDKNASNLSLKVGQRHPLQSDSEVTIFQHGRSLIHPAEPDVDTIIQTKYNTEERKLIIVDRSKGKIIDSRFMNVEKEMENALKQSYYTPCSTMNKITLEEEYVYEKISDLPNLCTFVEEKGKEKLKATKTVWESNWKEFDKLHEHFLQSILKNQPEICFSHLSSKTSKLPIDINYRYQSNWAPIHYAAMHYCPEIIKRLIIYPQIDVNALTDFNETPLHIAAKSDQLQNCLILIEAGVCIDKRDNDQNTALHYASELGYREIVKALLAHGASCLIPNCTGTTAIEMALPQLADLFEKYKEKAVEEDSMLRGRTNHRNIIEKMLQLNKKGSQQMQSPRKKQPDEKQSLVLEKKKSKKDTQYWRKKNIFKIYQFIQSSQKIESITLSSFIFYKKIGEGAFGQVYLVKRQDVLDDDNLYALKAIKKERVFGTSLYRYIQTERDILSLVDHPFVVRLRFAFQTEGHLFLVMDYCEGGDLCKLLQKKRRFTEQQVRNYACEILLGLEALHKYNIIFRDLKPDNIVLDRDGHALITDFGLSKKTDDIDSMNKSFCGTPAYLPLEIINKRGHNRMVDWYQFGVVLYELYIGCPPYHADTKRELYEIVRKGVIRFSKNTPELFKDLIKRLMAQNPEKRLGFQKDAESIRAHPWFADVDWQEVIQRRLQMPDIELKDNIGQPITTKFHDIKSESNTIPMWSFMQQ